MFVRRRHGRCLILLLYVDDNILTGNDSSLLFDLIKVACLLRSLR
jgi:hypothetical protein